MAAYLRKPTRLLPRFFSIQSSEFSTSAPPAFPSFRAVRSAIESESDPIKLAQIFESTTPFARFRRHRPTFHFAVRKLARSSRPDLVDRILNHTLQSSPAHLNSEGFWIRIIMLYAEAGMVDHAVRAFHRMGCPRSEKSLCAIFSVYLKNKMYDKVHDAFTSFPKNINVPPGVKSYNLVLKTFCEEKRVESARALLDDMETKAKVVPNIDSYNTLLYCYLENGDQSKFDELLKMILNKGFEPNLSTYNYRLFRLCKSKECARAKKLLDEMVLKGVKPNSASYNAIIFGFCRVGDLESARKILERMVEDGFVLPPSCSYYTLMRYMVEEGEFDSALEMCKEIMKRKWIPPFEAMKDLVNGLVKISKVEEAKEVVQKMKKRLRGNAADSWGQIETALPL